MWMYKHVMVLYIYSKLCRTVYGCGFERAIFMLILVDTSKKWWFCLKYILQIEQFVIDIKNHLGTIPKDAPTFYPVIIFASMSSYPWTEGNMSKTRKTQLVAQSRFEQVYEFHLFKKYQGISQAHQVWSYYWDFMILVSMFIYI